MSDYDRGFADAIDAAVKIASEELECGRTIKPKNKWETGFHAGYVDCAEFLEKDISALKHPEPGAAVAQHVVGGAAPARNPIQAILDPENQPSQFGTTIASVGLHAVQDAKGGDE